VYGRRPAVFSLFTLLATLVIALAAPPTGASAAPESLSALRSVLTREMARAGSDSGAYVYDTSAHRLLYESRGDVAHPPASVEKLYTSTAALVHFGPAAQLPTTVLGVGALDASGVWHGNLYLHGGGDPTFGTTRFIDAIYGDGQGASATQLANALRRAGVRRVLGKVLGDESLFDSLRGGPTTDYATDPEVEGVLSALAFNRGAIGGATGLHAPAAYAAQQFAAALHTAGIKVTGGTGTGIAPPAAIRLAAVGSPPLSTVLRLMDTPSDNYLAETLVKDLGAYFGGAGTTPAGAAVVKATIAALGIHISVIDGSGLSRSDATTPDQVATLLSDYVASPLYGVLHAALARPGQTGTLSDRMGGSPAVGRCVAKTGTLDFVSNLAGWCQAAGGHTLAFAFLMDNVDVLAAHVLQDTMVEALARYNDGTPAGAPAPPPPLLATVTQPSGPTAPSGATGPTGPTGAGSVTGAGGAAGGGGTAGAGGAPSATGGTSG